MQYTATPLPSRLTVQQWNILKSLNHDTTKIIHDALLPRTSTQEAFIILPHSKYTSKEYVDTLKRIAVLFNYVLTEADFVVMDESHLSDSSGPESSSPDNEEVFQFSA